MLVSVFMFHDFNPSIRLDSIGNAREREREREREIAFVLYNIGIH